MFAKKIILTLACLPALLLSQKTEAQPAPQSPTITDSVRITTRSGIDIWALVVRKPVNHAMPAVLFYTTYYQGPGDSIFASRMAQRDYVGVLAYARGIKTNLDHYTPFENDADDVYDIIDWISRQSWCNGSVGMYGGSYTGFAQWAALKKIHPALKTIVPQVAVMPGFDFPMENNVPLSHSLQWSHDNIFKRQPLPRSIPFDYFNNGIAYNKMDSIAGYQNRIFQKWLQHPAYNDYWQRMIPNRESFSKISIPILTTTGYYDGSQISALEYFKKHTLYHKNAEHYLVIGPYDHWGGQRRPQKVLMNYTIDSAANISMMELAFEWLDYVLKGKPKPALLKNKINYEVMGLNKWKHAPGLAQTNNDSIVLYLRNGLLSPHFKKGTGFSKQTVDFNDRENQNNYYTPQIVFDSLDASNGLVYTTAPFTKTFILNGAFTGKLFAGINKKDMDISLALYEIMPNGKYFFISRYVGRASFANDASRQQLLVPGRVQEIPIGHTRFVSKQISNGSRLVVLLNINKHPFEIINYGSGKPVAQETIEDAGEPLHIKWYSNSYIKIPVWK